MNLIKVKCAFCGKEFLRRKGQFKEAKKFNWGQYCSPDCLSNERTKRLLLPCDNCGKKFKRSFHEISPRHNYCSKSCAAIVNNKRRPKRVAQLKTCVKCGEQFVKSKGNLKYCSARCRRRAERGRKYTHNQLIKIIKLAVQEQKRIPTKRELRKIADACIGSFGSWNNAIITAGFQPNRSHNQRMYKCARAKALDGHLCDSISELIIDNWLTENKIIHNRNVPYPKTNHKADWGINSMGQTIFVEYFGLVKDSPRYNRSVKEKKDICRKYRIQLIEIYPQDLYSKGCVSREKLEERFKLLFN